MKDENRSGRSPRSLYDGDEDGGQLVALLSQRLELRRIGEACVDEEFQPVCRLFQFSQRIAAFGDEFGLASPAMGFAVIRTD